jgi:gliding motility-associated-like protein
MSFLFRFFLLSVVIFTFFTINGQNSINTSGAGLRWVLVGDIDVAGNQITVEAIFRKSTTANATNLVSKHTDPATCNYLLRPNSFQMATTDGFYVCTNPQPTLLNTWYHAAATYDGASIKYYINGCLVNTIPATGNLITTDLITGIGMQSQNPLATTENFKGNIDEVRIWNIARTEQEIQLNMNFLLPTTQPGLLAYYKFNNNYLNSQGNASFDGVPQGTLSFDVEAPLFIPLAIVATIPTAASCFGYSDGSIAVTAVGTGTLTYSIDGTNYVATSNFSNLSAGNYTIYVKSPQGCVVSQSVIVSEPAQVPIPTIQAPTVVCQNDTISLSVDSLTGYTVTWFGPNAYTSNSFDTTLLNVTSNLNGIYNAFYTFQGCNSDTASYQLTINPVYNLTIDTTICSNETYALGTQQLATPGFYTLSLQTISGCDSIINLNLSVNPAYSIIRDTSFCENETFTFQGQSISVTGTYPFYLQTQLGCDSTIIYNVIVYPIPAPPTITSNSPLLCPGDIFTFAADSIQNGYYQWTGVNNFNSSSSSNSFSALPSDQGFYEVNVTLNGCVSQNSSTELTIINLYTFDDFDFPNVISANNDNINDSLDLESYFQTCQEFTFYLHDRWGNIIYQFSRGETPFTGVDNKGNILMDGVYFYALKYEKGSKQGFIHLLR